ncbi:MAG TPA: MFS transporter [Anaerolineales bacterium]
MTLIIGMLADRLGRKRFLLMGYLVAMGGSLILIAAQELWQFWIVSSLVLASRSVITSMAPAFATDILKRRFLGKALPLVGTMNWASGVIGFAGSGYVLERFGPVNLYGTGSILAITAAMIVIFLPSGLKKSPPQQALGYLEEVRVTHC